MCPLFTKSFVKGKYFNFKTSFSWQVSLSKLQSFEAMSFHKSSSNFFTKILRLNKLRSPLINRFYVNRKDTHSAQWWQSLVCCLWTLSDSRWWRGACLPSCTGPCPSWSGGGDRDQSWQSSGCTWKNEIKSTLCASLTGMALLLKFFTILGKMEYSLRNRIINNYNVLKVKI